MVHFEAKEALLKEISSFKLSGDNEEDLKIKEKSTSGKKLAEFLFPKTNRSKIQPRSWTVCLPN